MLSFARDPQGVSNDWLQSQCRDLKVEDPGQVQRDLRPVRLTVAFFPSGEARDKTFFSVFQGPVYS